MKKNTLIACAIFLCWACLAPAAFSQHRLSAKPQKVRFAFYNVENLFDTEDDPLTRDEEFTPAAPKEWTEARYRTKLERLARVADGMQYPAFLGLAEVENRRVCKDFIKKTSMKRHRYKIVHFDSPDARGIDVALLYRKKFFKVLEASTIRINFPDGLKGGRPGYTTRDVLVVEGIFQKKDTLYLVIVHSPSRSGGQKASEPKRIFVAQQIRKKVDEIFSKNPNANIVLMGDLNDEPADPSVRDYLQAQPMSEPTGPAELYDCLSQLDADGQGSYNYRGDWNMIDHVILSGNLFGGSRRLQYVDSGIFREDWMIYTDPKYGQRPNRTYGGDHYFGGFSDHLPVFVDLKIEGKRKR
jgi:endonuclease/exonuclease/phosphatase family metal-dependent hydrolase